MVKKTGNKTIKKKKGKRNPPAWIKNMVKELERLTGNALRSDLNPIVVQKWAVNSGKQCRFLRKQQKKYKDQVKFGQCHYLILLFQEYRKIIESQAVILIDDQTNFIYPSGHWLQHYWDALENITSLKHELI